MKLLKQDIKRDGSGQITLVAQDREDLWTLYNLLHQHDEISLHTFRNIKREGKAKNERKNVILTLDIETVSYEDTLRIKGRTVVENDDVPLGSYHTAEVLFNSKFTILKQEWDQVSLDQIDKACSIDAKAEIGAVVLEEGVAHLCLITENITFLKSKVEKSIPKKKRGDSAAHDKAYARFLDLCYDSIIRNFNIDALKVVLVISPGFTAQNLVQTILRRATQDSNKQLLLSRSKFVVGQSSTGYLQGIEEALESPDLRKRLEDTKFAQQIRMIELLLQNLNEDNDKSWYGLKECERAIELVGSVKTLLISDSLFRNDDPKIRRHYVQMVESVQNQGGSVEIFSSLHDSGKQLDQLSGVAVILNYPVPDLDEDEEES
ncbi:unnamed protein product [Kuraishia capsulata CBS 1993]|uniref:Protein DOM34 homolog n=1 Tax=Kuraishia capsulata CBS 1993 TaxID=1382522 RepID=W6MF57_9ASCO|nr:uncharacterized protein KUCA_T00000269001 [Kuraishia capsulata CBS 1993]CDK24309.1 unnamed protein product [Kuraishia capsulata CBS 1993]